MDKRDENKILIDGSFDELLYDLILDINRYPRMYPSISGGEGTAFFIDDNFVVKSFKVRKNQYGHSLLYNNFEDFCSELKSFADRSLNVPQIYSWKRVVSEDDEVSKFYILEERVKGRELYYDSINKFYNKVSNFYSEEYFNEIVENLSPKANYEEILLNYIQDFLEINGRLEALPQDSINKFLMDNYEIFLSGRYSHIDMYSTNIFIDENTLTTIDQSYFYNNESIKIRKNNSGNEMFYGLMRVFHLSNQFSYLIIQMKHSRSFANEDLGRFDKLIEENEKIVVNAVIRFIKTLKKIVDNPKINDNYLKIITNELGFFLNLKNIPTILEQLEK